MSGTLELHHINLDQLRCAAGVFSGEVALVTGAATGIGKRGAVITFTPGGSRRSDIKPEITGLFTTPSFLGLEVDLTDEAGVLDCLEQAVRAYGGLDMLVLNAGIFPPSRNLEALTLDHWRQVMQINLDVNVTLLREAYPLLKLAPRYGRVVINHRAMSQHPGLEPQHTQLQKQPSPSWGVWPR
jgi:NAD(P)-dependent dehydrogenase (short-subunit alcohol dehydrogenase family)